MEHVLMEFKVDTYRSGGGGREKRGGGRRKIYIFTHSGGRRWKEKGGLVGEETLTQLVNSH